MIERSGSIFGSSANIIVCPADCEGNLLEGISKEFGKCFPELKHKYSMLGAEGEIRIGSATPHLNETVENQTVLLLPIRTIRKGPVLENYLRMGFESLAQYFLSQKRKTPLVVAIPLFFEWSSRIKIEKIKTMLISLENELGSTVCIEAYSRRGI